MRSTRLVKQWARDTEKTRKDEQTEEDEDGERERVKC